MVRTTVTLQSPDISTSQANQMQAAGTKDTAEEAVEEEEGTKNATGRQTLQLPIIHTIYPKL